MTGAGVAELPATDAAELRQDATTTAAPTSAAGRLRTHWRGLVLRPVVLGLVLLAVYVWVRSRTLDSIEKRSLNAHEIAGELVEHLKLSLLATVITVLVAVPLGVLLTRPFARWIRPVGLGLGNLGQAIPSIGLLVLLAFWIGTGFAAAVIALVAYSALPILRNTIVGLEGVDRSLVEAGRGMGMSRTAVLRRIELPLAVPVILAGVRTALVLTVATATLGTFIGAGGLGGGLVVGINLNRPSVSLTYGVLAAVLALLADWLGSLAEDVLRPHGI
jgi:ABC-type proline/glycine betaine transport system permease subunit